MRTALRTGLIAATVAGLLAAGVAAAATASADAPAVPAAARQTLAANDGWGSAGPGTTGGAADGAHVFVVRTRDELAAAVAGSAPKIVLVVGTIDANAGHTPPDEAFPTTPGPWCSWCDYRKTCPAGQQSAPKDPWTAVDRPPTPPEPDARTFPQADARAAAQLPDVDAPD